MTEEQFIMTPSMDGADPDIPLREPQPDPQAPPPGSAGRAMLAGALREGDPSIDDATAGREDGAPYQGAS